MSFINVPPEASSDGISELTGDVTAIGPGSAVATIAGSITTNITNGLYNNLNLQIARAMGANVLGYSAGVGYPTSAAYAHADATAKFVAVYLPVAATLTGVRLIVSVQGVYTADQENNIALYTTSIVDGTMTRVAVSANDGNLWKAAANTYVSVPFTSTYVASAGLYYVGMVYNNSAQTTAPRINCDLPVFTGALAPLGTTYGKLTFTRGSVSALASSYNINSGMSNDTPVPCCWLY